MGAAADDIRGWCHGRGCIPWARLQAVRRGGEAARRPRASRSRQLKKENQAITMEITMEITTFSAFTAVKLAISTCTGIRGQPGAQKSDSRVPFQLWPKMGGEGGPMPHAPGEPGGAVWKPFSCVLRPSAPGRPFSAVSSVVDERFTPHSSSLTIGISPDSVGTASSPPTDPGSQKYFLFIGFFHRVSPSPL